MIHKVFSKLIADYCGNYIENLDVKKFHLDIFKGDVTLSNLKLRPFALDDIDWNIPFVISLGIIGSVNLKIPWTSLKSNPVICEISDVFIVLVPKSEYPFDEVSEAMRYEEYKLTRLHQFELQKKADKQEKKKKEKEKSSSGFVEKLAETIINNIQIKVNNIHIRYEDSTDPKRPLVVGCTLDALFAQTVDKNWQKTFTKPNDPITYKLVELNNFSIYVNCNENPERVFFSRAKNMYLEQYKELMRQSIYKNNFKYVLNPVFGHLKLTMQKLGLSDFKKPQFDVDVVFEEISFTLDDIQYRCLLSAIAHLTNYPNYAEQRKYRPKVPVEEAPIEWWKYAVRCQLNKLNKNRISWEEMVKRREDRKIYLQLYKKFLNVPWVPPMTKEELQLFNEIERRRSLNDLLYFRKLGSAEIEEEEKRHAEWMKEKKIQKKKKWLNLITNAPKKIIPPRIKLTEEQRLELYKSIGYNAEESKENLPSDLVKVKIHIHLTNALFKLWDTINDLPIVQMHLGDFIISSQLMEGAFTCLVTMGEFTVFDKINKQSRFNSLLSRRRDFKQSRSTLLSMCIEKNPPGKKTDYYFGLTLDRVDVVINLQVIQRIVGFFMVDHVNFSHLENIAQQQIKIIKRFAQEEIRLALESKKTVDINLEIKAPHVIVPVDCNDENTPFLFFDFGKLSVKSDIDTERLMKIKQTTDHIEQQDLYDKFFISFSDIQLLVPQVPVDELTDFNHTLEQDSRIQLIEKVSFSIDVSKSIMPSDATLPLFKIAGKVPSIKLNVSNEHMAVIAQLSSRILAFIDNPSEFAPSDVKMCDTLRVKGPITKNKWKQCYVEVKATRRIFFYDANDRSKRLGCIKLSNRVQVKASKSQSRGFRIELPQAKGKPIRFLFLCKDQQIRDNWVKNLKSTVILFDDIFYFGKLATILGSSSGNYDLIVNKSVQHIIIDSKFQLEKFTSIFYRKGENIFSVVLDNLSTNFEHRAYDTVFKTNLQSITVNDFVTKKENESDIESKYIMISDRAPNENLVDIKISYSTSIESPLYNDDAMIVMKSVFQSVKLFARPKVISHLVQFGYDIRELFDGIDFHKNVFYAPILLSDSPKEEEPVMIKKKKQGYVKMGMKTNHINVLFMNENISFATVTMAGSTVSLQVDSNAINISGSLGNVVAIDHSIKDSLYKEILGLSNKDEGSLIDFNYTQKLEKGLKIAYSKFLTAKMSSIRYIHVQRFINTLLNYAKGPILEALQREKVRQVVTHMDTMEEAKKSTSNKLIKVQLELVKPTIVIPANYTSKEKFIVDLGRITISNCLKSKDRTFWLEAYDIDLKNIHLESVHITEKEPIKILKEMDVQLNITRALVNPDYSYPEHYIRGNISDITFELCHLQFQLLFDMLNENIKEGLKTLQTDRAIYKSISSLAHRKGEKVEEKEEMDVVYAQSDSEDEETNKEVIPIIWDVQLRVPSMKISLLRGNGRTEEGKKNPIGELNITKMDMKTIITKEDEINIQTKLGNMLAFDTRVDSTNVFKKVFDSRSDEKGFCFQFIFEQKMTKEKFVELHLSDPYIVIVPDMIIEFIHFFKSTKYQRQSLVASKKEITALGDDLEKLSKEELSKAKISFSGQFGHPEIILPEDTSDQNCRQLVIELGLEIDVKKFINEEIGAFQMKGLTAYIKHQETKFKGVAIIEPISVNTQLTSSHSHRTIIVEVAEGGKMRISYQDLKLISEIAKRFAIKDANSEQIEKEFQKEEDTLEENQIKLEKALQVELKERLSKNKNTFTIKFSTKHQISILLVDDYKNYDVPLLDFNIGDVILTAVLIQEKKLSVNSSLSFIMFANYYNFAKAEWEPILESTPPIKLAYERNITNQDDVHKLSLTMDQVANFNVTHSMVDTLMKTSKLWITNLTSSKPTISEKFKMYSIINESGLSFKFKLPETGEKILLEHRQEVRFGFDDLCQSKNIIELEYEGESLKVNVSKVSKYFLSVKGEENKTICIETSLQNGRKIISLHGGIKLQNFSTVAWEAGCWISDNVESFGVIEPKQTICVPFKYVNEGMFTLRPKNNPSYSWGKKNQKYTFHRLVNKSLPRVMKCRNPNNKNDKFYCVLDIKNLSSHQNLIDAVIQLRAPLAIENLLPCSIEYTLFDNVGNEGLNGIYQSVLQKGEKQFIYSVNLISSLWMRASQNDSHNLQWTSKDYNLIYSSKPNIALDTRFRNYDQFKREIYLNLDYSISGDAFHEVMIYSNYWIINQTGLNVKILSDGKEIAGQVHGQENQPILFSFSHSNLILANKISILVDDNYLSELFSIDNVGTGMDIQVKNENRAFNIGMFVDLGPGKFNRTKIVTFTPRFIIVNKTKDRLTIRQYLDHHDFEIENEQSLKFYWQRKDENPMVCVKLSTTEWSNPMKIRNLGEIPLILRTRRDVKTGKKLHYLIANIQQEHGTIFIIFESTKYAPYYLINSTDYDIEISQQGTNQWLLIKKGKNRVPFTFLDFTGRHNLLVQIKDKRTKLNIDVVSNFKKLNVDDKTINIFVTAKGRSRFVHFIDKNETLEIQNVEKTHAIPIFQFTANIKGIGCSIIDNSEDYPQEMMYIINDTIKISCTVSDKDVKTELKVKKLQINNQLRDAVFPVLFTNSHKLEDGKYFIYISLLHEYKEKSYYSFPLLSIMIQEADLLLDWEYVNLLTNFITTLLPQKEEDLNEKMITMIQEPKIEQQDVKKTYFDLFAIHPIKFNLTFIFNMTDNPSSKQSRAAVVAQTIGVSMNANIDNVPIKLNSLILNNPFMSKVSLLDTIKKHYTRLFMSEMYKVIGSFAFIGNPVGLVTDIDTGFLELWKRPLDAIMSNPEEVPKEFIGGITSFIKHTVHGTFNSASKFSESIGNGLSYLSMDNEFIANRQRFNRAKPKHIGEGLKNATIALTYSIVEGATGIIKKPIEGIQEGFGGFIWGIGKGLIGIPIKPITGAVDFVSRTAEGLRNTTTYFDKEEYVRTRKPRLFGLDGILIPYHEYSAEGQYLLWTLENGKYKKEHYIHHVTLNSINRAMVLSDKHLFMVIIPSKTVEWVHEYEDLKEVVKIDRVGMVVVLSEIGVQKQGSGWFSSPIIQRDVRIEDSADDPNLNSMYTKLTKVLDIMKKKM